MFASIMTEGLSDGELWVHAVAGDDVIEGVFLDAAYSDFLYAAAMLSGSVDRLLDVEYISVEYVSDDLGAMTSMVHVSEPPSWHTLAKLFASLPHDTIAICHVDIVRSLRHVL